MVDRLVQKRQTADRRAHRARARIRGTAERPRLSVSISNLHVTAQVIDDESSKTLAYATSVGQKLENNLSGKAAYVGAEIAKKAVKAKVSKVAFDKGSRKFHGRLKTLADAAREGGLEF